MRHWDHRSRPFLHRAITLLLFFLFGISFGTAQITQIPSREVEGRVDAILSKMTLDEKLTIIGGINDFYIQAIPRLGLPALRMSDGPLGVHDYGPTTAYPAGILLAAAWDTELARRVGESMGQDARGRGVHFILAPGMNIYRAPMNGRNFEYFGEDPYLASRMAVSVVQGIQSQGVIATVKHFAANNMEYGRLDHSSDVDERTLREIYLPAFEASVKEAKAGAVMDAYNLVNGVYMTQNNILNNVVLKKEWGFDGILMSDWGATHDGVAAANAGLDLEMPSGAFMNKHTLLPAIQSGQVSEGTIDDKVRRILRKAIQFGFYDHEQTDTDVPLYSVKGRELVLEEARTYLPLAEKTPVKRVLKEIVLGGGKLGLTTVLLNQRLAGADTDCASQADLYFQASVTTWQAYNAWGGESLYADADDDIPGGFAVQVTFDRPYLAWNGTGQMLRWEQYMARYLERSQIVRSSENYRLDVMSNDWWGEPLGAMLSRVLIEELGQRVPQSTVIGESGAVTASPDATLELNVQRLDEDATGNLVLQAQASVGFKGRGAPVLRSFRFVVTPPTPGIPGEVTAISAAVGQLADGLTSMLLGR